MHPARTSYRLAHSSKDYRACHQLLKGLQIAAGTLSWPTVMAIREGEVIGCLSTQTDKGAIIAGPLAVSTTPPSLVALRLVEAYEHVLQRLGLQGYYFGVVAGTQRWVNLLA